MSNSNQYTKMFFLKKLWGFLSFVLDFFKNRNVEKEKEQEIKKEKIVKELKEKYKEIDNKKEENDLNKKLNNMF